MECGTANTRLDSTGLSPLYLYNMTDSPKDSSTVGDRGLHSGVGDDDSARSETWSRWSSHRKAVYVFTKDRRGIDDIWNSRQAASASPESANSNGLCVPRNDRLALSDSNIHEADKSNSSDENFGNTDDVISHVVDLSSDDEQDADKVSDNYCIGYTCCIFQGPGGSLEGAMSPLPAKIMKIRRLLHVFLF